MPKQWNSVRLDPEQPDVVIICVYRAIGWGGESKEERKRRDYANEWQEKQTKKRGRRREEERKRAKMDEYLYIKLTGLVIQFKNEGKILMDTNDTQGRQMYPLMHSLSHSLTNSLTHTHARTHIQTHSLLEDIIVMVILLPWIKQINVSQENAKYRK